jgi:hypothetical protein
VQEHEERGGHLLAIDHTLALWPNWATRADQRITEPNDFSLTLSHLTIRGPEHASGAMDVCAVLARPAFRKGERSTAIMIPPLLVCTALPLCHSSSTCAVHHQLHAAPSSSPSSGSYWGNSGIGRGASTALV